MTIGSKITIEKILRYVFLLLSIGAGLMVLLNLSTCLGIGDNDPIIRGWVNYVHPTSQPEVLQMTNGQIKIYAMGQTQFTVVHFDSLSALLHGIPLVWLISQVLSELAIAIVFYQMMQIFRSLDLGEVFRTKNISRLSRIAYAIVTFSVLTFLNSTLLATFIQGSGETFRSAYTAVTHERVLFGILVALIILALVKAFKIGTQLQQEQDLTI